MARGGVLLGLLAIPLGSGLGAQGSASPPPADAKALKTLHDQLELARKERLALEARLEKQTAEDVAARAKTLAMSGEVGALQRLELLLDSAQARLLLQRDRLRLMQEPAEATLRADKLGAGELVVKGGRLVPAPRTSKDSTP